MQKPRAEETTVQSTINQAASAVTSAAELTYEELKAKLQQAEAQLVALKDSGLRQRNVKSSDDEKRTVGQTAQAVTQTVEGVPVQMAAILCLVSFLLAYLFF